MRNFFIFFLLVLLGSSPVQARKVVRHPVAHSFKKHTPGSSPSRKTSAKDNTSVVVYDISANKVLISKNEKKVRPIASITKLMTYAVDQKNTIIFNKKPETTFIKASAVLDADTIRNTSFKLVPDRYYSLEVLRQLYIVASNNNAAMAVARYWDDVALEKGKFVEDMNRFAALHRLKSMSFLDSTGLHAENSSNALDLAKFIALLSNDPHIPGYSLPEVSTLDKNLTLSIKKNTNALVREKGQKPLISKTGYIKESGFNLAYVPSPESCQDKKYAIVLLGFGSSAQRTKYMLELLSKLGCSL